MAKLGKTNRKRSAEKGRKGSRHKKTHRWVSDHMSVREYAREVGAVFDKPCLRYWLEHKSKFSGRRVLLPFQCKERGRCVTCAIAYGEEQGEELFTLIEADLGRLRHELRPGEPLAWHITPTLPATMRATLRTLQEQHRKRELSRRLSELGRVIREYLAYLFGCKPSELGVSINWHDWSSEDPLGPAKFHAHVIVPNVTGAGFKLSTLGTLPEERVKKARQDVYREGLNEVFPETPMPKELDVNVFIEWSKNTPNGWKQLKHDCTYAARSVWKDVLADSRKRPEFFHEPERYKAFLLRSQWMQPLKTRRYLGHLHPGQRKRYGLVQVESGAGRQWEPVKDGFRTLVRVTETGFRMAKGELRSFTGAPWVEVDVPAELIQMPNMPGRRWNYDEGRDEKKKERDEKYNDSS